MTVFPAGSGPPHGVLALVIVSGFLVMLLADHLQGGSGHLRHAAGHDSDDEDLEEGLAPMTHSQHKVRFPAISSIREGGSKLDRINSLCLPRFIELSGSIEALH